MDWVKISLSSQQKEELKNAERQTDRKPLLKRLQCLGLKDKGWKHEEVADFLDISVNSVTNWLRAYQKGGIPELLQWGYKGKVSVLSLKDQEELRKRNKEKPFMTAKEAKVFIKERFGIKWHLHWVQKLLKKNFTVHSKR